jgi:hypothetical protein
MSDTTAPLTAEAPPPTSTPARGPEVAAQLLAALVIGSVLPFLVAWTSPAFAFGMTPYGFELVDIMPQLVALVALGIAVLARSRGFGWLRSSGWLLAAAGLLGLAGLYAQQSTLDGQTLTLALTAVIALSIVGTLLAFAQADGAGRWGVAAGLAAGIAGGREVVALVVGALREGRFAGTPHGDDVVFAGLGLVVAGAGVMQQVLRRASAPRPATAALALPAWWRFAGWPIGAFVVASVLAVGLTSAWNARLEAIIRSYIGGISEENSLALQTRDQLVRLGIAVVVTAVLVAVAHRSGGSAAARWVLVAFGMALLVGLPGLLALEPSWPTAVLGPAGAAAGTALVHRIDAALPWEALGLALAAGLFVVDAPTVVSYVAAAGAGLAVAAGIVRLAPLPSGPVRRGPGRAPVAATLGVATWLLGHQVVAPVAAIYRVDPGAVPILALGLLLAAAAIVIFYLLGRVKTASG